MLTLGRSRTRRRPIVATEAAPATLSRALWNLELAERRAVDGQSLRESTTELEQRLFDPGWQRFAILTEAEFTVEGRRQMRAVCRLMATANALIKRGLSLRSAYVHGQGVQITARANGTEDGPEQDVQAVVQAFVIDEGNERAWYGAGARDRLERTLGTDGELYACLFTRPLTGDVQIRVLLADEITEIICNPEDRNEPWFYRRTWIETRYDPAAGVPQQAQRERLHPAVGYRPARRSKRFAGLDIAWDAPILHVDVNRPEHWQHGVPDVYAAINWARAYKTYLEQWATLMSALSRYAWRTTASGSKQARQIRSAVTAASPYRPETAEVGDIGQMVVTGADQTLEAIPKSGATIDSESGRPLAMMVASALDLPVTMLLGDPGQTGARAVAETLDQPTELAMQQRREVWRAADMRILRYVIAESVRAPRGALKGTIRRDQFRDRETVELAGDTDPTIDIYWPDLDDVDPKDVVEAVTKAAASGVVPPEVILRLLLAALGVRDADTIVEDMVGPDGEFLWPATGPAPGATAGNTPPGQPGAPAATPPLDGQGQPVQAGNPGMPDQNPSTAGPGQLVTAAIEHATSGNWAALNADTDALVQAAQSNATPASDLPAWWADSEAVDDDWRVDAALARGADVAAAYGSQHAGDDDDAVRRGFDIFAAEQQITGGQAPTFDAFAAAARDASKYTPTVQLDNRLVATAVRVGTYAATVGEPVSTCPYQGADPGQAALRRVWLSAYLRIRPAGSTGAPSDAATVADAAGGDAAGATDGAGDSRG